MDVYVSTVLGTPSRVPGASALADAKARSGSLPAFPLGILADPPCGAANSDQSAPLGSWFVSDSALKAV